jgi:hypothetical protein
MKYLNRKTVWLGFAMPLWAKAVGLLAVVGFIVFVGAVAYLGVKVHYFFTTIHPHNGDRTNNVAQIQTEIVDTAPYPAIASSLNSQDLVPVRTADFALVYGVPGPWIQGGAKARLDALMASAATPTPFVTADTDSEYDFYLDFGGRWFYFTSTLTTNLDCYVTNYDGTVENQCLVTNDDGTVTDWSLTWSDAATQVDGPPKGIATLHTIVIERTTDFIRWTPIFTNLYCPDNCPQFFTDTNAPADMGFYRVMTQ